ncbi:MAG: betaine/proline/choline family ABC transporter ATP-binding protein [Gammaproteobacteria bacterium]|nr:betaine/proline/choline family ABC transporter ATP-binding protein [Gammaproteobacteria bacterium]
MSETQPSSASHSEAAVPVVKLSCRHVWKVFGDDVQSLFTADGQIDQMALDGGEYISAVRDASFDVYEGEIFVIMGLSGSGKSTLLRCMTRLIEPSAGEIFFEAQDLMKASESELINLRRHKMGMVFQHFALLPNRTVLGNVALPLEVQGISRGLREQRALEVIELVGLDGRERYYPRELSGGQQQRVGIARSLAAEPDVWFLDEPFSALDPLIRREMQDEFMRLQNVLHKSIVFITHDFEEAIRLADRIAIMKDGAMIQIGTREQLVLNPATDYVEELTQGIPRAKVLSAEALMRDVDDDEFSGVVQAGAAIETQLDMILNADRGAVFAVHNERTETIGALTREVVVDLLAATPRKS